VNHDAELVGRSYVLGDVALAEGAGGAAPVGRWPSGRRSLETRSRVG